MIAHRVKQRGRRTRNSSANTSTAASLKRVRRGANTSPAASSAEYKCEVCPLKYKTERGLQIHAKKHGSHYTCTQCAAVFLEPLEQIVHVHDAHTSAAAAGGAEAYECALCDYRGADTDEMRDHLAARHAKLPRYTCALCKKGFNVYSWYMEHANFHTGDKPFVCELCGKAFPYSRYLASHKTSMHFADEHGYSKVYACELCKKTYSHRNSLLVHMNSHTGNVAVCDICGKTLSSKEKLKLHYRIHTGYKPFKCEYCEKAFTKKTILVEHVRIHTGERPYQCEYCEKRFSQRTSLVIHIRSHTGERPYVCHICGKGFVARAMLNIHFKSCRGVEAPPPPRTPAAVP